MTELHIVAIPPDWELSGADLCINLCEHNIDGTSQNYDMSKVSGLDPRVQGQVAAHTDTVFARMHAILVIEFRGASLLYLQCTGGTHRSPALACLLCTIAYTNAKLGLVTERTQRAAADAGWATTPGTPW